MEEIQDPEGFFTQPIRIFLTLVFGLSWPVLLLAFGWFDSPEAIFARYLLSCTGMLMVALAAFITRRFVEHSGFGDVGWNLSNYKWYLAALLFSLVCWLVPSLLAMALGLLERNREVSRDALTVAFLSLAGFSVIAGFGEEFGWRGYLLARFSADRKRARESIVIIGFIWGVWHFPVALGPPLRAALEGSPRLASMIMPALLDCGRMIGITILLSFIFGAIWLKTRSILLMSVLHGYFIGFRDAIGILLGVSMLSIPFLIVVLMGIWAMSFRWLERYEIGKEE